MSKHESAPEPAPAKTLEQQAQEMADYAMEMLAPLSLEERERRISAMVAAAYAPPPALPSEPSAASEESITAMSRASFACANRGHVKKGRMACLACGGLEIDLARVDEREKAARAERERATVMQAVQDLMADSAYVSLHNHGWETLKRWAAGEVIYPPQTPQRDIVAKAMDALESDATDEQRREAWDALRDEFFPLPAAIRAPRPPEPARCGNPNHAEPGACGPACRWEPPSSPTPPSEEPQKSGYCGNFTHGCETKGQHYICGPQPVPSPEPASLAEVMEKFNHSAPETQKAAVEVLTRAGLIEPAREEPRLNPCDKENCSECDGNQ